MSDSLVKNTGATQQQSMAKARKPYHTPKLENYGAVNELTRGGGTLAVGDGTELFSYASGN